MRFRLHTWIYASDLYQFIPNFTREVEPEKTRKGKWRVGKLLFRADGTLCFPTPKPYLYRYSYRPPFLEIIK